MKKHLCIVAAAALTVGGMGLPLRAQDAPPADNQNALERGAERTGEAVRDAGQATGDVARDAASGTRDALGLEGDHPSANSEEIYDVLAQVAQAALTKEGLDDMAERLVDADRNRLGENQDALKSTEEIDGRIAQIQQDWKAKYNEDFDMDEDAVFKGFAMVQEGEIGQPRTAGDRVADPAEGVDAPRANTDGQTAADRNLNDPGRNIASVTIKESHGLPMVKVPMIHEAGGWKIDLPDSVDAAKFHEAVKTALTKVGDSKDQWPADKTEAYRHVTHSILAGLFEGQADAGAAQPAAGRQPGDLTAQPRDLSAPAPSDQQIQPAEPAPAQPQ